MGYPKLKMGIHFLFLLIVFLFTLTQCNKDDGVSSKGSGTPKGPFKITAKNYTCTSWTISEDGGVLVVTEKSGSTDSFTTTSFTIDGGNYTFHFSPDPDTCFFSGFFMGYVYKEGDMTVTIQCDMVITIGTMLITIGVDED